jgi:hypothetical protein
MDWYLPDPQYPSGERGQNKYERTNVSRILNYEKRIGCKGEAPPPLQPPGCPFWPAQRIRYLSNAELANCSCTQLELLRNEIFARHGRIFTRQDLQRYFNNQPWYMPNPDDPSGKRGQNKYERSNTQKIRKYEKVIGCR